MLSSPDRRISAHVISDLLGRVLTGPVAFLLAGLIDVLGFTAQSLRAQIRGWPSRRRQMNGR